jgi:hypothetical protein
MCCILLSLVLWPYCDISIDKLLRIGWYLTFYMVPDTSPSVGMPSCPTPIHHLASADYAHEVYELLTMQSNHAVSLEALHHNL